MVSDSAVFTATDSGGHKTLKTVSITINPPATKLFFGSAVGSPNVNAAGDDLAEWKRVKSLYPAALGVPNIRRYYTSGTVNTYTDQLPGANVYPFFSQKPDLIQMANGSLDSWATAFAKSCLPGYYTIQHECDNPSKGISPQVFDAGFSRWAKICKSVNPSILIGPVFMEFQIRIQGNNFAYGKGIDPSLIDFWGVDTYSNYDIPSRTFAQCMTAPIAYFNKLAPSKFFIAAETGNLIADKNTGAPIDRPQWLFDGIVWGRSNNTIILQYDVNTSTKPWKFTDTETKRLAALLSTL